MSVIKAKTSSYVNKQKLIKVSKYLIKIISSYLILTYNENQALLFCFDYKQYKNPTKE